MSVISSVWMIKDVEKSKYDTIFDSLGPVNGKLHGDKVRPVLLDSKLSLDILRKVWELSDIDKDGYLDRDEFSVAMHLVYRAIDNEPVPSTLPSNLIPPSKRNQSSSAPSGLDRLLPGAVAVLPSKATKSLSRHGSSSSNHIISPKHSNTQAQPLSRWAVSPPDRSRFVSIFQQNKTDNSISGEAAKNVFVQSGLPQNILAHVWSMCDQRQTGSLTQDQFVLAMHLISQKVKGVELPAQVTAEMISASSYDSGFGDSGNLSDASSNLGDSSAIRELDALTQEIEELRREKESLTCEIQTKETAIKTTSLEVQGLQDALDRDSSSLAQLECDKAEARTRLDELEQQRSKLDAMLSDVRVKVQDEGDNIKSLRAQISAQEASVSQQESELKRVKQQLADLQKDRTQLEQRLEAEKQVQGNVERSVKEVRAEIEKVQSQLRSLQNQEKSVSSNIEQYDKAAAALKDKPRDSSTANNLNNATLSASDSVFSMGGMQEKVDEIRKDISEDAFASDPFKTVDPFSGSDPFSSNPSAPTVADPFGGGTTASDPFGEANSTADPFGGANSTADPFGGTNSTADPFGGANSTADPFGGADSTADPFGGADSTADPFGGANSTADPFGAADSTADPFGSVDPFASTPGDQSDPFKVSGSSFGLKNNEMEKNKDPFGTQDPFSADSTGPKKSSPFASDPFSGSDAFSSGNNDFESIRDKPAFDSSLFEAAFPPHASASDVTEKTDAVNKQSDDPWGSAFGGSDAAGGATSDPFGGDAFGSDAFGKSSFGGQFKSQVALPKSEVSSGPRASAADAKRAQKAFLTESEQLAWAKEESRRAEEERRKKQEQEQADLELAIRLSKQDG